MKGLIALVLVAFLAMSAYNCWQIGRLQQEVADLRTRVNTPPAPTPTDALIGELAVQFERARRAVEGTDPQRARQAVEDARRTLDQASRAAGEKAGPALDWFRKQAQDLEAKARTR